jgi:hypothetical protein
MAACPRRAAPIASRHVQSLLHEQQHRWAQACCIDEHAARLLLGRGNRSAGRISTLASYARQAHDETMLKLAMRIQGRAMRRVGELLKEIKPSKGGRPTEETYVGADIGLSRSEAARQAGLSDRQKNTALRVASIPPAEFEAAVESDKPRTGRARELFGALIPKRRRTDQGRRLSCRRCRGDCMSRPLQAQ